jgi:hypothetical protein
MDKAVGGCALVVLCVAGLVWLFVGGVIGGVRDGIERQSNPQAYEQRVRTQARRQELYRSLYEKEHGACTATYGNSVRLYRANPANTAPLTADDLKSMSNLAAADVRRLGEVREFAIEMNSELDEFGRLSAPRTSGDSDCVRISRTLASESFRSMSDDAFVVMSVPVQLAIPITREEAEAARGLGYRVLNRVMEGQSRWFLATPPMTVGESSSELVRIEFQRTCFGNAAPPPLFRVRPVSFDFASEHVQSGFSSKYEGSSDIVKSYRN